MFVRFDVDRCIQAAAVLFSTTQTKTMGRLRLLKLLYLANRKSLEETGDPIVDDDAFAMKYGPVLSRTYDLIKGTESDASALAAWNNHFAVVDSIQIHMQSDPGTGHLSNYDVETLEKIAAQYRDFEDDDLSELTHSFEEYRRHWTGNQASERIPEKDLLEGIGFSGSKIEEMLRDARAYAIEGRALGCRYRRVGRSSVRTTSSPRTFNTSG